MNFLRLFFRTARRLSLVPSRLTALCLGAVLLLGSAPVLVAQETGTVRGRVLNAQTGRYMERVQVQVVDSSRRTFTNQFGEYELYGLPPGPVELRATFTGMTPQTSVLIVEAGETVNRDFTFRALPTGAAEGDEEGFELAEFEVRASDSFQTAQEIAIQSERFSVNFKNVVDTNAYGITAQGNVGEFVKFIPGVTIGYGGTYSSAADANTIQVRGFSARETNVTIDGMGIASASPGTLDPAVGLDMLSVNNAARVEVIKVPSPDQPNAGVGGTVNLISKTAFEYPKPTLNFRVYVGMNSENLNVFHRTPGPMNKSTYKTLPSFDMTYAVPFSDTFGMTLTLASANQVNENNTLKSRIQRNPESWRPVNRLETATFTLGSGNDRQTFSYWTQLDPQFSQWQQTYGEDWTQWTDDDFRAIYGSTNASQALVEVRLREVKRLPRYDAQDNLVGAWSAADKAAYESNVPLYYDENGNLVGRVLADWMHPYINRVQVTDSPRISERNSAALKFDWRPLDGLVLTTSYQISTFKDQDASRRVHQIGGTPVEYGPDYVLSNTGRVRLDTDAFGRSGTTHTAYIRGSYIKGPWQIGGHISYSHSESDLLSIENGHFSVIQVNLGNVDFSEFRDIDQYGVPKTVNYYRDVTDADGVVTRERIDIGKLENYNIANFNPNNPTAGTLVARSGGINSLSTVTSAKFDVRRDLDFIKSDFMNLAIKVGIDLEERENTKSGRGANYESVYLGQEGRVLSILDFRDESYRNVAPGFGMAPLEWPDPFALYAYAQNNPGAFSDTSDVVRGSGANARSIAAHNHLEAANTSKGITERKWASYGQLEGEFLNNRLSIVGGFRYSESRRKGYDRGQNPNWNLLALNRDTNGNGLLDVFDRVGGIDIDPSYGVTQLGQFNITGPTILTSALRLDQEATTFQELKPDVQANIMRWFGYYEQAGAVYPDGRPFIASEYEMLEEGTLQAYQYQFLKDFPIDQRAQGRPQPIISAAYDITDKLVARISWAITYSNPPYESSQGAAGTLRRVQFIEDLDDIRTDPVTGEETGFGGSMNLSNPSLTASKTEGWDVGLSYYTESGGVLSAAVYYRTEHDRAVDVFYSATGGNREPWEKLMIDMGFGPGSYYFTNEWAVNTSVNANGTFVDYGFELEARQDLAILGGIGKYFYVYGSYFEQFQQEGKTPEGFEEYYLIREGTERRINASGGVSFNYKRLNLRTNFTWRNARTSTSDQALLDGVIWDDPTVGNPGWYTPTIEDDSNEPFFYRMRLVRPADLRIDLSGSFRLTDHYTFDFSARNIFNSNPEPLYVREDGMKLPLYGNIDDASQRTTYGVNFTVGISGSF